MPTTTRSDSPWRKTTRSLPESPFRNLRLSPRTVPLTLLAQPQCRSGFLAKRRQPVNRDRGRASSVVWVRSASRPVHGEPVLVRPKESKQRTVVTVRPWWQMVGQPERYQPVYVEGRDEPQYVMPG